MNLKIINNENLMKKENSQKEKHKEFKYKNEIEEEQIETKIISEFNFDECLEPKEQKEKEINEKEVALNLMLTKISIGEVI